MKIDRIVRVHIYLLLIILPFLAVIKEQIPLIRVGGSTLIGFSKEILSFSLFFILFLAVVKIILKEKKIILRKIYYIYFLLVIWEFIHLFIGFQTIIQRFNGFRFQFIYASIFLLLYIYIDMKNKWSQYQSFFDSVIKIFLIQSIFVLLIAYIEIVYPDILPLMYKSAYADMVHILGVPGKENIRIVSTFGNPINLGLYLSLSFIFYLYILDDKKQNMLYLFTYVVFFLVPLFLTFSRTSYGIFTLLFILFFLIKFKKQPLYGAFSLIFIIGIFIYIFMVYSDDIAIYTDLIIYRIDQFLNPDLVSHDPRIDNIKHFLSFVFFQGDIFYMWGGGLGLSDPSHKSVNSFSAENGFATILAEQGFVGIILFILVLIKFFYNSIRLIYSKNNKYTLYGYALFYILVWFMLATMTSDTIKNNPFSLYFWLFFFFSEYLIAIRKKLL